MVFDVCLDNHRAAEYWIFNGIICSMMFIKSKSFKPLKSWKAFISMKYKHFMSASNLFLKCMKFVLLEIEKIQGKRIIYLKILQIYWHHHLTDSFFRIFRNALNLYFDFPDFFNQMTAAIQLNILQNILMNCVISF